jgi:hypothetical protein
MDTVNKIIVNGLTNETEIIPLTDVEIKALAKQASEEEENRLALEAEAEAKAAQRQALLDRLGITSEEAKILLGA